MAELAPALKKTLLKEGEFSNDPADPGGMTFRGIARRKWPNWRGWPIIDAAIAAKEISILPSAKYSALHAAVEEFYDQHFWTPIMGLRILDQRLAEHLFDAAVNCGISNGVQFLQAALNKANLNQRLWPDLAEDGVLGEYTLRITNFIPENRKRIVRNLFNISRAMYYWRLMEKDPSRERWVGWFNRIEIEES